MDFKGLIPFVFMFVLLFSFGCQQQQEAESTGPFLGGSGGVTIEFANLAPISQFDQGEEVPVKVSLRNEGEYEILQGNAKAKIYGIKLSDFGLAEGYKGTAGKLSPIESNMEGGRQDIDFGRMNYGLPIINSQDFDIWAKVCYPYQTRALVDVCLKSTLSQEADDGEVCSIEGEKVVDGSVSAGPIQVTSVTQSLRGSSQVRFNIRLENSNVGNVYSTGASCEELEDEFTKLDYKDQVNFEVVRPLDAECRFVDSDDSNAGVVYLDDGSAEVSCWVDVEDTYADKLGIALSYTYTDTTMKTVTIYEAT